MQRVSLLLALLLGLPVSASAAEASRVEGEAAWTSALPAASAEFRDPGFPASAIAAVRLGELESSAVDRLKADNRQPGRKALRIGVERPLNQDAMVLDAGRLRWLPAPGGGLTARLSVSSAGAAALRLGLRIEGLPPGGELRFASSQAGGLLAPMLDRAQIQRITAVQPRLWTPITEGDTQMLEVYLPAGQDPRWLRLDVDAVSHLLVSPTTNYDRAKIGESEQPCMLDVQCEANPSAAFTSAKNAVASMVFEADGGSAVCTGTLLADSDSSTQVPYFFSAAHCFTSQAVASTLTTLWFYEATACGSGVEAATTQQVAGGAQVLYGDDASDVLFLRLNNPAPNGSTYLGWDSSAVSAGSEFLVIHHPAGDAKKYSRGLITGLGPSSLASGSFIQVAYATAPTEGGSSGSGLLTAGSNGFLLRGGLLGGASSCDNVNTDSPDNADDYSRFDLAFPSLRQYLQPSTTPPPSGTDYSGAWSNPAQSGWGLNVIRGASGTYGMYIYHYDDESTPAWYLSFGALSGTRFEQPVFTFNGPWFGIAPFNPAAVSNATTGSLTVNFTSATTATINFTIDGRNVSTQLSKLAF